jgi:hypothetical protein
MTYLDLFAMYFWPFVFVAAAWGVAIYALTEPSDFSAIVRVLTNHRAPRPPDHEASNDR